MALKPTVNEFEFQTLADPIKAEYKKQEDGTYSLDLGGAFVTDKDPAGLMSALEKEREQNRGVKEKLDKLEAERDKATQEAELAAAKTKEEITATLQKQQEERDRQWQERLDAEKELREKQQKAIADQHLQSEASKLANELAGNNAPLLLPHIMQRMRAVPGETPTVEFLDDNGQPSPVLNSENFKSSFLTKDHFKPILVGSKASGGSASGENSVSGTTKPDGSPKTYKDYSSGELVRLKRDAPDEFRRLQETR